MKSKLFNITFNAKKVSLFVIAFTFALTINAQQITKGPYLLVPTDKSVTIRWETDGNMKGNLIYGKKNKLNKSKIAKLRGIKEGFYLYEATLENLRSCTTYNYQIKYNKLGSIHHFKTNCPNKDTFSFVAMGDSRSNPAIFSKILKNIEKDRPEIMISMGDLVETGGDFKQWDEFYFSIAGKLIDQVPLISTLGDHETNGDNGELFRHFMMKGESVDKQWFSFDYYNAHFISLDYRHADNKEMIEWFVNDISKSKAKWKFVYFHRPVYNFGGHRSRWGQEIWAELFHKYNVDIVFAGHSHIYERFFPVVNKKEVNSWPVTYITTGGSGAGLYDVGKSDFLAVAESVNHFVHLNIDKNTLQLFTYRNDGSLLDSLEIKKKNKTHSKEYLDLAIDEEVLKIQSMFIAGIKFTLDHIPFRRYGAPVNLKFNSISDKDIPFAMELTKESSKYYKMEPVSGVLKSHDAMNIKISIFSKTTVNVSGWGSITPHLRLKLTYVYKGKEYTITGGPANYWPDIY